MTSDVPRFCGNCGQPLPLGGGFCPECGARAPEPVPVPAAPPAALPVEPTRRYLEVLRRVAFTIVLFVAAFGSSYRRTDYVAVSVSDSGAEWLKNPTQSLNASLRDSYSGNNCMRRAQGPFWGNLVKRLETRPDYAESTERRVLLVASDPRVAGAFAPDERYGRCVVDWQDGERQGRLLLMRDNATARGVDALPLTVRSPLLWPTLAAWPLALLLYAFLRWRRGKGVVLAYQSGVAAFADLFGALIIAGVGYGAGRSGDLSAVVLTLIAVPLFLLGVHFSVLRVHETDEGLMRTSLFGRKLYRYQDIAAVTISQERQNPMVGIAMILVGLTNCVMIPVGIALLLRKGERLSVSCTDGGGFGFWTKTSSFIQERLMPALGRRGIVVYQQ